MDDPLESGSIWITTESSIELSMGLPGRGLWLCIVAANARVAASLVVHPSLATKALLRMTSPATGVVKMQYGYDQQQGYGQQQGYDQQQGYGQQGDYQQQQGYGGGSQALWSIHAFSGVMGHNKFSGAVSELNKDRFRSVCEKYGQLPYTLIGGDERILCRWNIVNDPGTSVSRSQCKVSLYPDGTAVLTSMGSCSPTLWRSQGGPWNALCIRPQQEPSPGLAHALAQHIQPHSTYLVTTRSSPIVRSCPAVGR